MVVVVMIIVTDGDGYDNNSWQIVVVMIIMVTDGGVCDDEVTDGGGCDA